METVKVKKPETVKSGAKLKGHITIEVFNNREEMKLIGKSETDNIAVYQGLNSMLGTYFSDDTQLTDWYCVISETNTSPSASMTYATPSFTEWAAYDEETRPAWEEGGASSQSITNSASKAELTANDTKTLYGAGLVAGGTGAATKSNTAGGGTLFNYGLFAASQPVVDNNVVNLTVTISAADDGV